MKTPFQPTHYFENGVALDQYMLTGLLAVTSTETVVAMTNSIQTDTVGAFGSVFFGTVI